MKKKLLSLLLMTAALVFFVQTAALAVNPPVTDEAGYLTDYQIDSLNERLEKLRDKYNVDVAVYIEKYMVGDDRQKRADDIYDYNGYGIGSGYDGIMMYISASPREYVFTTCGSAINAFNSRGIAHLTDAVDSHMKSSQYYNAILAYAETADEMLEMAANGKPYNDPGARAKTIAWAAAIIIPIIIAAVATHIRGKKMNTAVYRDYADSYMKSGSMRLSMANDLFLYSTISRTERPKDTGGGTHTSASGRTHGGGGGGSY